MHPQDHCEDVSILIVGQNRFQQDLLISSLQKIQGCQCTFSTTDFFLGTHIQKWSDSDKKLVFIDCFGLPGHDILDVLCAVSQGVCNETPIALFNLDCDAEFEMNALSLGARGFFYPHDSIEDFCVGTRAMQRGEIRVSRIIMSDKILSNVKLAQQSIPQESAEGLDALSAREKEVLSLLGSGASNKAIAETLFISPHTVRTHLYNAYQKINVTSRSHAVLWVIKNLPST